MGIKSAYNSDQLQLGFSKTTSHDFLRSFNSATICNLNFYIYFILYFNLKIHTPPFARFRFFIVFKYIKKENALFWFFYAHYGKHNHFTNSIINFWIFLNNFYYFSKLLNHVSFCLHSFNFHYFWDVFTIKSRIGYIQKHNIYLFIYLFYSIYVNDGQNENTTFKRIK